MELGEVRERNVRGLMGGEGRGMGFDLWGGLRSGEEGGGVLAVRVLRGGKGLVGSMEVGRAKARWWRKRGRRDGVGIGMVGDSRDLFYSVRGFWRRGSQSMQRSGC